MKDNYSLFYSYKNIGDVLIVIFDNQKQMTHSQRKGQVEVIYHQQDVIGYNIFDIQPIVKIKTNGIIYLPGAKFLKVINDLLKNNQVEQLNSKTHSGYFIGQISDIQDLHNHQSLTTIDINNKQKIIALVENDDVKIGDKIVVAISNTMLNNGHKVIEITINNQLVNGHICSEKELQISNSDKILLLDKEEKNGEDFFSVEDWQNDGSRTKKTR